MALGKHRHRSIQNASAYTAAICLSNAESVLEDSKRVKKKLATIKGHPGLEPGDTVEVRLRPGATPRDMILISFSETLGQVYDQTINEMIPLEPDTP
jgi:hypothetical protein